MQARETMLPPGLIKVHPLVETHVHQHRIPAPDLLARRPQRSLHLAHRDRSPELDVREVQRDGRRVEVFQGHFVDGRAAGAEVLEGVDVRAGVVGHCQGVGGGAEGCFACYFGLVRVPGGLDLGCSWVC